ncbi:hypothetical protein HDV03_001994 [Kappamyces sp. JEL0829]|nr:hypothetical protein HDV03_001994 [Kappamyces sp. JEL0829]
MSHQTCTLSAEAVAQFKTLRFRKEKTNAALILKIDPKELVVVVDEYLQDIAISELASELPESAPRQDHRSSLAIYGYRKILAKCMLEALHVYDRSNITPVSLTNLPFHVLPYVMLYAPSFFFNWLFPRVIQVDDKATSSMYEDLKAKRDTEIEYLQGEIVRLARLADVAVPYCEAVRARVLECQTQRSGVPHLAAEDILNKVE